MSVKEERTMTKNIVMMATVARAMERPDNQVPPSAFEPRRAPLAESSCSLAEWKNDWDNYDDHNDFPDAKPIPR